MGSISALKVMNYFVVILSPIVYMIVKLMNDFSSPPNIPTPTFLSQTSFSLSHNQNFLPDNCLMAKHAYQHIYKLCVLIFIRKGSVKEALCHYIFLASRLFMNIYILPCVFSGQALPFLTSMLCTIQKRKLLVYNIFYYYETERLPQQSYTSNGSNYLQKSVWYWNVSEPTTTSRNASNTSQLGRDVLQPQLFILKNMYAMTDYGRIHLPVNKTLTEP